MELAYRPLQRKLRSLEGHYIGTWLTQEYEPLPRSLANDGVGAFIDWLSFKITVQFLKTDPKARYQGYTFFFKEGLCWSDINTTFLKCRLKQKSINDVKSMSLYGLTTKVPEYYIICLINSTLMSYYVDNYVNNTQTFQINDARQLPIIVPSPDELKELRYIFDNAISIKTTTNNPDDLHRLQLRLDNIVDRIYSIK